MGITAPLLIMQSNGGTMPAEAACRPPSTSWSRGPPPWSSGLSGSRRRWTSATSSASTGWHDCEGVHCRGRTGDSSPGVRGGRRHERGPPPAEGGGICGGGSPPSISPRSVPAEAAWQGGPRRSITDRSPQRRSGAGAPSAMAWAVPSPRSPTPTWCSATEPESPAVRAAGDRRQKAEEAIGGWESGWAVDCRRGPRDPRHRELRHDPGPPQRLHRAGRDPGASCSSPSGQWASTRCWDGPVAGNVQGGGPPLLRGYSAPLGSSSPTSSTTWFEPFSGGWMKWTFKRPTAR